MEPALKQRLLGAFVLIALAVIFLPMFFSGAPPRSSQESVSLDIPPLPDSDLKTRTFDVAPASETGRSAAVTQADDDVATRVIADRAPPPPQPTVAEAPASEPASEPPATTTTNDEATGAGQAAVQRFAVSVGVFADADGARQRLARASKAGYPMFTSTLEVDGKPATGVRAGPFASRGAAEAARLKLQAALPGVKPSLVAWSENRASDTPASAIGKDQPGAWDVQLAAFSQKADAEKLRQRARDLGFDAFIDSVRGADGPLWRVRVGPQAERSGAEKLSARLGRKMHMQGIVVSHH